MFSIQIPSALRQIDLKPWRSDVGISNEIVNTDSGKFERNVHKVSAAVSCIVGVARIFFTPTLRSIKLCLKVPRKIDPIMFLNLNKHL